MVPEDIVTWTLLIEGITLCLLVVWFLGHGLWLQRYQRWSQPLLDQAREALTIALDDPTRSRELLEPFRKLPMRLQIRLFSELLPTLSGEQKQWLTNLGRELRLTTRAERQCRSRWWWRRLRGARLITLLGAREAVMIPLLVDRNPYVRAQAAEWAVNRPDAATVDILLALLSDPDGWCRFAVQDSLLRMGGSVVERLAVYLSTHVGHEVKAPLQIAINIADPRLLPPAIALTHDPISEIRTLAATLLGTLGGAQATEVLTALLADSDPAVRAAATRALGKLSHWPAAATLAALLRDQVWEVRKEAGLALAALGAPGILFLNRALKGNDPFAADMARHVLDLSSHA
jgi:hypothetical protein